MSEPITTTVNEPTRPVSALEQTLRDKADDWQNSWVYSRQDPMEAYEESAKLVHARDAQLWALADTFKKYQWLACAELLIAILEGKTNE